MSAPNPVLTTIIFVFALQAIALSVLLLSKRPRQQANIFLALLVFFAWFLVIVQNEEAAAAAASTAAVS